MCRIVRWSWIGLLWLGVTCPAVSAGEMSDLFPEGTILYLNWPGLDQLTQSCKDTALGRIMAEPQMVPLREKLVPALVALIRKQAASDAEEELVGLACDLGRSFGKYPLAVGLGGVGGGGTMVDAAVVVRAGKDAPKLQEQVERLARRAELPLEAATTLPADSKLKMQQLAILGPLMPIRWGVVGDDFIVSLGTKTTDLLIGGDGVKRLTGSPHFTAAMKATGGSGATPLLYLDLAETVKTLEAFQAMFAAGDVPILGVPGGLRKVLDETGLGKLESLTLVQAPEAGGFRTTFFARFPGMDSSQGSRLCGEPLTDADLALVPKDATSASVDNGDVAELYRWGLNLAKVLGPELADPVSQGIAEVEKRLGMKIDEDLLAGFGDTWVWYNSPGAGGFWFTGLTVIAEVKADNRLDQGLQAIVKAIADAADAEDQVTVQRETYRDQTITFVNCPGVPMPIAPAWTIYKNRWVMALYPQMVRAALDHMMTQGPSLLDNTDFQRGYQLLPKGACSVVYSDTAEGVRQLYAIGLPVSQLLLSVGQGEGLELDASVLPSLSCISKHLFGDVGCLVAVPDGWMMVGHGPLPVEIPSMGEGGMAIPLAVSILLPSLARARETARETVSLMNLKSIGIGLHMYASEHGGKFPPSLNTLLKAGTIKPETLISPLDRDPSRKCSYIYVAGHTEKSNPGDVLAYERPPSGGKERIGVLFLDGHAELMNMTAFKEALKNTAERLGRPLKAGEENEGAPVKEEEQKEESK